ncbi:MAG: alkaline phosphatase family protein [Deltaproteobacteria bacterium]|nr:alkaline phosphatase family protein [Deltaproteobacteria bacterium]
MSVSSEPNKNPTQSQLNNTTVKYAVVITIDGLRPDAISKSNSPNINSFMKQGSYTFEACTVIPPRTLPAHTSLVTGLDTKKHKQKLNFWNPSMIYVDKETIFSIAKKQGLKTAMFVGKNKLEYLAKPGSIDHFESTGEAADSIEKIGSHFSAYVKSAKPQLTLIHFPEPDLTGHKRGWMSRDYIKAFEKVDRAIGVIIESLREAGIYPETIIIITSDHGGEGKTHEGSDPQVMTIPWIAFGKVVKKDYKIKEEVYIYDTASTVLSALGINIPMELDGKPAKEIFINQKRFTGKE